MASVIPNMTARQFRTAAIRRQVGAYNRIEKFGRMDDLAQRWFKRAAKDWVLSRLVDMRIVL